MRCRVIHPHLQFLLHSVLRPMLALLLCHLMSNVVKMHAFHAESRMDAPLPDRQRAFILRAWQDSQILLDLLFNVRRGGRCREAAPLHPPHALLGGPASRLSPR